MPLTRLGAEVREAAVVARTPREPDPKAGRRPTAHCRSARHRRCEAPPSETCAPASDDIPGSDDAPASLGAPPSGRAAAGVRRAAAGVGRAAAGRRVSRWRPLCRHWYPWCRRWSSCPALLVSVVPPPAASPVGSVPAVAESTHPPLVSELSLAPKVSPDWPDAACSKVWVSI